MKTNHLILFTLTLLCLSAKKQKPFPTFQYHSVEGEVINNQIFNNKESMVVVGHLGCYALMLLMRDLQDTTFSPDFQPVFILENTRDQILEFNSTSSNMWAGLRFQYALDPLTGIVIGECEYEKIKYSHGDTIILNQCRNIAKKLKTKDSPSIYFVNGDGFIERSFKGYFMSSDNKSMLHLLFTTN